MISFSQNSRPPQFAAVCLLYLAIAVTSFSIAGTEEQPRTAVSGKVIDAKTRKPVQRYEIILLQPADQTVPRIETSEIGRTQISEISRTQIDDRGGKFRISAPAGASIRVLADTFLPAEMALTPGQKPLEIKLQAGIRVRGTVSSAQGSPMAGVDVTYRASSPLQGGWFDRKTRTDAKGAYEITLAPGDSFTAFSKEGFVREEVSFTAAEKQPPREVTLYPAVSARGQVLDDLGQPVAGARLRASWLTRSGVLKDVVTDDQGRFALTDLRQGSHKLEVSKASYASFLRPSVELPAAEDLRIRLDRGATVSGTVTGIAEEEKPYVFIYLNETMTAANLVGKYGIRGVPPGPTAVVAEFASQGKLKRSAVKRVELRNGVAAEVNLDFVNEKGTRGKVREGEKAAIRAVVELTSEGSPGRPARVAVAEDGSFEIVGLEPGDYNLAVPGHQLLSEKKVKLGSGAELDISVKKDPAPDGQLPMPPAATKPSS